MLSKQQKLAILSKAIDEGAVIDISFFHKKKGDAAVTTTELAEMMGTSTDGKSRENTHWYQTFSEDRDLKVTAFYEQPKQSYMVEDVVRTIEEGVN